MSVSPGPSQGAACEVGGDGRKGGSATGASRERILVAAWAVAIGLLVGMPRLAIPLLMHKPGYRYMPLVTKLAGMTDYDETAYYAPRIRDALDGHPFSADFGGWEHKSDRPFLGHGVVDSLVIALVGKLIHANTPALYAIFDFVLPPIAFLLVYGLARALLMPLWAAVLGATLFLLVPEASLMPVGAFTRPQDTVGAAFPGPLNCPVELSRLLVPQFSGLMWYGALLALLLIWLRPTFRQAAALALLLGALCYSYTFYWTSVAVAAGLLALVGLLGAGRKAGWTIASALAVALVLGAPVIWQDLSPDGYAGKAELLDRLGRIGHQVQWSHEKVSGATLLALLLLYPKRRREYPFYAAALVAPFLCVLGAEAIGLGVQDSHWLFRAFEPVAALCLIHLAWHAAEGVRTWRFRRQGRATDPPPRRLKPDLFFALAAVVVLGYVAFWQTGYTAHMGSSFLVPSATCDALRELERSAPAGSVVVAMNEEALALIPVYTHCNVYLPYCIMSPASTDELITRAGITLAAYGTSPAAVHRLLERPRKSYHDRYESWLGQWIFHRLLPHGGAPPALRAQTEAAAATRTLTDLVGPEARFRADFIWWGPEERSNGNPAWENRWRKDLFVDTGGVRIYRLRQTGPAGARMAGAAPPR